jgi:hypothetical protein
MATYLGFNIATVAMINILLQTIAYTLESRSYK